MTRVAVVGAAGRLGSFAVRLLESGAGEGRFRLVAQIERDDDLAGALQRSGAEVALDCTVAGLGAEHGEVMLRAGVRPVIGTSGVTAEQAARLDELARELSLGGLVVPNFSLGVCLQQHLADLAARHLPRVEIVESHHENKRDAPSGTAADTARRLAAITGRDVPIHSLRLPGLLSNQEVVFGGPGEVLRLVHETYGLEAFGPGILAALAHAERAEGVAVGLGAVLLD